MRYRQDVTDAIGCPRCEVEPGEPCWGARRRTTGQRRIRSANHDERLQAWRDYRLGGQQANVRDGVYVTSGGALVRVVPP